jgi:S1-C subfamily serine protease
MNLNCAACGRPLDSEDRYCAGCGAGPGLKAEAWADAPPWVRFCAAGLDTAVLVLVGWILYGRGHSLAWLIPVWLLAVWAGWLLRGSPGKWLLGVRVSGGGAKEFWYRETVGKLSSTALAGIGYLCAFSRERRALHDYMAGTRVVSDPRGSSLRPFIAGLILVAFAGAAGYLGARYGYRHAVTAGVAQPPDSWDPVMRQIDGVLTFYTYDSDGAETGSGSGFVLSPDGLAVTNYHVLRGAAEASVRLGDGRVFDVVLVKSVDRRRDLFVVRLGRLIGDKVEWPTDLEPLRMGSSETVQLGDRVAVLSSPWGLENSLSDGLVSGFREREGQRLIQFSAPISPGSSGGPVFSRSGEVVGVATLQFAEGQNLNFAVPVEAVDKISEKFEDLALDEFARKDIDGRYNAAFTRGMGRYDAGEFRKALSDFLLVQRLSPKMADAYYNAAMCLEKLGRKDRAAEQYRKYLLYAPEDDEDRADAKRWLTEHGYRVK